MLETLILKTGELLAKFIPLECMQFPFMQTALLAVLLLAPLTAVTGVQAVNMRMAFFTDAIGHSAFAGAAAGILIFGTSAPMWSMPLTALLIGWGVLILQKISKLSNDTLIGVFFAFVVSGGLLLLSFAPSPAQLSQMFLFGDILLITPGDITYLFILALLNIIFLVFPCNKLLILSISEDLAYIHTSQCGMLKFITVSLLALTVIFGVKAMGVLLMGAMLIVPAAAARNLASCAGKVYPWAIFISLFSGVTGLFISAQEW